MCCDAPWDIGGAPYHWSVQQTTNLPARPSIVQAAEFLNVDPKTVRRYIAQGRLKACRIGPRLIRVDRQSVLDLARPIGGAA
jgi:excisionase family DNA binding protein